MNSLNYSGSLDEKILNMKSLLVKIRRHIHANPETGLNQPATVLYLAKQFEDMDVGIKMGDDHVGMVVDIKGDLEGPTIAFRADMDALEIEETDNPDHVANKLGFRSTIANKMHACGHDVHTAILFGLGKYCYENRKQLKGTIRLLFQPGEEGYNGAKRMIEKGYLDNVAFVFALHCYPPLYSGVLAMRKGGIFSAIDKFNVMVSGQGGHSSAPEKASDQTLAVCRVINNLQSIVSRNISALDSAVLSVCYVNAGNKEAITVIPEKVEFNGTVRTFNSKVQKKIKNDFVNICTASVKTVSEKCNVNIDYTELYPVTKNDDHVVDKIIPFLSKRLGEQNLIVNCKPLLGSEDFSCMLQKVPGVMMLLGTTPSQNDILTQPYFHTPDFDIDENSILVGVQVLSDIALKI